MNDEKLYSFIQKVVERPAMYSVNNVEDLHLIIQGYLMGSKKEENGSFILYFREFSNKYFRSKNDIDWVRLIRFHSASDKHSLELFLRIFSLALEKAPKDYKIIIAKK